MVFTRIGTAKLVFSTSELGIGRCGDPILIIIERHAGFQRGQDEGLPHRLGRHPSGKPGAAEIDRPLLVDATIDRPVRDECIKRILR